MSTVFRHVVSTTKVGQTWLTLETQPRARTSWAAQPAAAAVLSLSQDTYEGGSVVTDGAAEPRVIVFHRVFSVASFMWTRTKSDLRIPSETLPMISEVESCGMRRDGKRHLAVV